MSSVVLDHTLVLKIHWFIHCINTLVCLDVYSSFTWFWVHLPLLQMRIQFSYTHNTDTAFLLSLSCQYMLCVSKLYFTIYTLLSFFGFENFCCYVDFQWCCWRKLIGWQRMRSMHYDVRWRNTVPLVDWFSAATPQHVSFRQYAVDVLLSGLQLPRMMRLTYYHFCIWSLYWSCCMSVVYLLATMQHGAVCST